MRRMPRCLHLTVCGTQSQTTITEAASTPAALADLALRAGFPAWQACLGKAQPSHSATRL